MGRAYSAALELVRRGLARVLGVNVFNNSVVFLSDFGLRDGAVAAMKGVAIGVNNTLNIFDITHEIPPYNILEGAYRLMQSASYWPSGTVFVAVVDPGVGTTRRSVVARAAGGQVFVCPDNGLLHFVAQQLGPLQVRVMDENKQRLQGSQSSHTFLGRDLYSYVAARLAAGLLSWEDVGELAPTPIRSLELHVPELNASSAKGSIPVLDINFGHVWTDIPGTWLKDAGIAQGSMLRVQITHGDNSVFVGDIPYVRTFAEVGMGHPLVYINSMLNVAVALHQGNFAQAFAVSSGAAWRIVLSPA